MKFNKLLFIPLLMTILAGAILLFVFSSEKTTSEVSDEDFYRKAFQKHYKIFAAKIPDSLDFAGEAVPLDRYDIRESLDRELLVNSYWHSNSQLMFKRAFRYFPLIDSILEAYEIPRDFRYLAMIESGLQNVVSPAGARGFWQIMKRTGLEYGLEINSEVDERYHLAKATEAACKYLLESKAKFGTWTLAAASYNMGRGATNRVLSNQKQNSYYDLYLNAETARYMFRILAVKTIYEHPTEYGFYFRERDFYPPLITKIVETNKDLIDWVEFATEHEIPYKLLRLLNPWLRADHLTNRQEKTYQLVIPKDNGIFYSRIMKPYEAEQRIFNDTLLIKQIY